MTHSVHETSCNIQLAPAWNQCIDSMSVTSVTITDSSLVSVSVVITDCIAISKLKRNCKMINDSDNTNFSMR